MVLTCSNEIIVYEPLQERLYKELTHVFATKTGQYCNLLQATITTMDILSGITDACDTVIDAASNLVEETSSRSRHDNKHVRSTPRQRQRRRPHLPVLIIPGFMSSGLTVEKSHLLESWEGQRLWLNLKSLGLEKYYDTKASRERNRKRRQEDVMSMSETFEDGDDDDKEESDGEDLVPSRNLWSINCC